MSSKRLFLVQLVLIGVAVLALFGGVYVANSLLTKKSHDLVALKSKSLALEQEHQTLATYKNELKKYTELQSITRAVVPEDKNQAQAVGEIVKIAAANNINLASITFPASTLGATKAGATAGASGTAPPTAAAGAANLKMAGLSQLQPVKDIPGVYLLVITVQGDPQQSVPYSRFIAFLRDLEHNRRTAQVSNITLSPDSENRNNLTFSLSLNEYIKP
ncbi:MAG: hypothetical protein QFB86_00980 [Patescibacteria group bacterium]|nr:hypothetical protein [Patescibacteria group bacterium]